MLPRSLGRWLLLFVVLALASVLAFTACDDEEEEGVTPAEGETPAAETPAAIDISGVPELQDGVLNVGSDIAYAPMEYYEEGTQNEVGVDIDLARAMAELLGVEAEFQQVGSFEGIVGDLVAKRYDIIWSSISILPEREEQIDFVPYMGPVGTGVLVPTGNPESIQGLEDLCGRPVAAQVGTIEIDQMEAANEDVCKDNPIDVKAFPDNPTAVQELTLGRVDAELADDPVAAYSALQSDGKLELAVTEIEAATYGIGVRKDSPELKAALEEALQQMIDNGTYGQILAEWGQEEFAIQ